MFKEFYKRIVDLDRVRKRYLGFTVGTLVAFFIILTAVYIVQIGIHERSHAETSRNQLIEVKKEVLHDTVNNMIHNIEYSRIDLEKIQRERLDRYIYYFQTEDRIDSLKKFLSNEDMNSGVLAIVVNETGDMVFKTNNSVGYEEYLINEELDEVFLDIRSTKIGDYKFYIGVLNETVKREVTNIIRFRIYNDIYFEDAYIWINEVLSYQGGDNYAIRVVHPNLKDTEGSFLSTKMEDIMGTTPYLTELDGIKEDGEVYFNYYFKRLETDDIAEKITYAKLYEEYDWIVAMGVYYDDLDGYLSTTSKLVESQTRDALIILSLTGLLLLIIGLIIFFKLERDYYAKSNVDLKEQIDTDELTKAKSRRAGMKRLQADFDRFISTGENVTVLLMDIDDFKMINDNYGHDAGDKVLMNLVDRINNGIRDSDTLYRWGGEEFLIVSRDGSIDGLQNFISKVLSLVEKSDCRIDNSSILVSTSIGATQFKKSDKSYDDLIKRADDALYQSKKQGKNRGTIII